MTVELAMRPYTNADLPWLQTQLSDWIAKAGRCGYDHPGELPHRVYENLRGRHPVNHLVQIWQDAAGLAGIVINLRFGEAFDVFTAPELRGTDAERRMLRSGFTTTARYVRDTGQAGTAQRYVLTDTFDCDITRISLLDELGFERFRAWDDSRERDLTGPLDDPALPAGYRLRSARFDDAEQLAIARNHSFSETWTGDQYLRQVMRKPGYDPAREIVVEAPDGRIAAFVVYWLDDRNRIGHIEPVGTHQDFRRLGLARAAMLRAARLMAEHGMTTATVNHNAENLPARELYLSLGFRKRYGTSGYRRAV